MGRDHRPFRDPRGHSLRIYSDVYDSPAFAALSPHDVLAYLALLRELKGHNNGDLSLPLTRAKKCGLSHPKTLARSLRALCAAQGWLNQRRPATANAVPHDRPRVLCHSSKAPGGHEGNQRMEASHYHAAWA